MSESKMATMDAQIVEVQRLIEEHILKLEELTDNFVQTLIHSLPHIPYGIRWICKQIKVLMLERFPEATRVQICTKIAGFFLLRFVCPVLVAPDNYTLLAIVDTHTIVINRRSLVLVKFPFPLLHCLLSLSSLMFQVYQDYTESGN